MGKLYYESVDGKVFPIWFEANAKCHSDNNDTIIQLASGVVDKDYMIRCFNSVITEYDLLLELDTWYADEQKDLDELNEQQHCLSCRK